MQGVAVSLVKEVLRCQMRNILCSFKVNKVNEFTSVSCTPGSIQLSEEKHNLKKSLRVTMKVSALFCLTLIHINNVNDERAARGHKGGTDIRGAARRLG